MKRLIALLALLPTLASAEERTVQGAMVLAIQSPRFPCSRLLQMSQGQDFGVQTLYLTFGTDERCLLTFVKQGKQSGHRRVVSTHTSNESCRRMARCRQGELLPQLTVPAYGRALSTNRRPVLKAVIRRLRKVDNHLRKLEAEGAETWWSTGLEHRHSESAHRVIVSLMRSVNAKRKVINSPVPDYRIRAPWGADLLELHTTSASECRPGVIVSLDGYGIDDRAVATGGKTLARGQASSYFREARARACAAVFAWRSPWQGISKHFVDPRKRSFTISQADVTLVRQLIR